MYIEVLEPPNSHYPLLLGLSYDDLVCSGGLGSVVVYLMSVVSGSTLTIGPTAHMMDPHIVGVTGIFLGPTPSGRI
jgi:hypothetical protein